MDAIVKPSYEELEKRIQYLENRLARHKKTENLLQESVARYQAIVRSFEGFIYICSPEYRIEYLNDQFKKIIGHDATGEYCYTAIHGRDSVCPWCVNEQIFNGETVRWEIQSPKNNRWYSVSNSPLYHPDGRILKHSLIWDITENKQALEELKKHHDSLEEIIKQRTASLENITCKMRKELSERKQVEKALKESEEKYRLLLENATEGIVVTQDGMLKYLNFKVQEFIDVPKEELLTKPFLNYVHPEDQEMVMGHHIRRLKGEENPEPYELRLVGKDGRISWIKNNGVVISWKGAPATLNFLSDITEKKEAEQMIHMLTHQLLEARENERLKISRDLHDSVAQDLSSVQIGLKTLFDDETGVSEKVKSRLSLLSRQLKNSIASVRDLSYNLGPSSLDQLGLVQTVYQLCEDFSQKNNVLVDFSSAGMENIKLNFSIKINLYRVIQEALTNIQKHAQADSVVIRLIASSPNIICRIKDNGKGFEHREMINNALKYKRMGIRSMQERIRLLGGQIQIDSRPEKGTKIVMEIPIRE